MLYKQNFVYQLLVFQSFFSTTFRRQSMFDVKMRYRILWRQKKHHTSFLLHGRILCHTRQWWTWHITQKTTESILFSYCFLPQTVWVNMVIFTQKGEWNIHSPHYAPIIDKISWLDTKNPFGVSAKPFFFIWTKPAASYRCARLI